ncbi:GlcG/HbpS family heme-binding protein [Cupriavidus consociatus]|uniref:GlcG/HbpS family heme-binding protein n=1 Tax=Cupriavidus consociatus TaxID=2821357 RepID=UPI001AE3C4E1|nr:MULTISPECIES: heme-binding protein [unclassified Cupriavidus]MBP0625401.1 heme-binding protein [Cupriavidus sp. LEh25]MDK2662143.1 heme-binding protein [Cupriavidus sp. LEh21]
MTRLDLNAASLLIDTALAKGRELELEPLCVVVLDAGGYMIAAKREDGASILRPGIATGKAYGCLAMGFGGRELARRAEKNPAFMNALSDMTLGRVVPVPGGVLIRDDDGAVLGAVGVSGDASLKDEACALAGIAAAGLQADHGDPA